MIRAAIAAVLALASGFASASPVGADIAFGTNGKVYANVLFGASDDVATATVVQPDGLAVVAGPCQTGPSQDFCLARFNADGSLDAGFGRGGIVSTPVGVGDDIARAITLDGTKIVVAGACTQGGDTDFCVARYLANGALDTSFNGTGIAITPVGTLGDNAYAVTMSGSSILVGGECEVSGTTHFCLVRYLTNGALDASFGSGGKLIVPIMTGTVGANSDGIRSLSVSAGSILAGGRCVEGSNGKFCVARLTASGTLDATFGTGGTVSTFLTPFAGFQRFDLANAMSVMTGGGIVLAGQCRDANFLYQMCVLSLNADGTRNTNFNGTGQRIDTIAGTTSSRANAVATVSNNATYVAGSCTVAGVERFCVSAFNGLGSISGSFNGGQPLVDTLGQAGNVVANAIAAVFDANTLNTQVTVAGACGPQFAHTFCAARYLQTGVRVSGFGVFGVKVQALNQARLYDSLEALVPQADGKLVAGGTCGGNRACLVRFNADGSLDPSFASGGRYVGAAGSGGGAGSRIALEGTTIVFATSCAGRTLCILKLLFDGTPDTTWGGLSGTISPALPASVFSSNVAGVFPLAGGALVVGFTCPAGQFGIGDFCLVKLGPTGAYDATFNAGGPLPGLRQQSFGAQDTAQAMALDGSSFVMAGSCRVANNFDPCVMRFTAQGALDTAFNGGGQLSIPLGTTDADILAISINAGAITLGGYCTTGSKVDFCLARVTSAGALDATFNATGTTSLSLGLFPSRIQALVADGTSMIAAGRCDDDGTQFNSSVCLARFLANGNLDTAFNDSGIFRGQVGFANAPVNVAAILANGTQYRVGVQCRPPSGDNNPDFCLAGYYLLPATLPRAPTITSIQPGDTQLTVNFVPPSDNGGSPITSYTVACGTKTKTGAGSPLVVSNLLNGVSVACTVSATNVAGTGPASDPPMNGTPQKVTTVVVSASANPSSSTGTVTFFATVTGSGPTGFVNFKLPGNQFVPGCAGDFPVQAGVASCVTTSLTAPGTYSITAYYLGDAANVASNSAPYSHTVIVTAANLQVSRSGNGRGTVVSTPAGIDCGTTCSALFTLNSTVTLTATPAAATTVAWSGCTGVNGNVCTILVNQASAVAVTFSLVVGGDADGDGVPNELETSQGLDPYVKDNDLFANTVASQRLFVMQQYRDFLAREGDPAGIQGWMDFLQNGTYTRLQVIDAFLSSNEFAGNVAPVVRLYFATFLRVPDYAGLVFNAGLVKNGTITLTQLADFFTASPEFAATYGALDNTQFVTLLYNNVLGRAPDQAGLNGWLSLLQGGYTRGQVLLGFSDSVEYQAAMANEVFVTMMYTGMLRRSPEPAGFSGWLNFLDTAALTRTQVINGFFMSVEYHDRFLP